MVLTCSWFLLLPLSIETSAYKYSSEKQRKKNQELYFLFSFFLECSRTKINSTVFFNLKSLITFNRTTFVHCRRQIGVRGLDQFKLKVD